MTSNDDVRVYSTLIMDPVDLLEEELEYELDLRGNRELIANRRAATGWLREQLLRENNGEILRPGIGTSKAPPEEDIDHLRRELPDLRVNVNEGILKSSIPVFLSRLKHLGDRADRIRCDASTLQTVNGIVQQIETLVTELILIRDSQTNAARRNLANLKAQASSEQTPATTETAPIQLNATHSQPSLFTSPPTAQQASTSAAATVKPTAPSQPSPISAPNITAVDNIIDIEDDIEGPDVTNQVVNLREQTRIGLELERMCTKLKRLKAIQATNQTNFTQHCLLAGTELFQYNRVQVNKQPLNTAATQVANRNIFPSTAVHFQNTDIVDRAQQNPINRPLFNSSMRHPETSTAHIQAEHNVVYTSPTIGLHSSGPSQDEMSRYMQFRANQTNYPPQNLPHVNVAPAHIQPNQIVPNAQYDFFKPIPMDKWGIHFSGQKIIKPGELGLPEFLSQVERAAWSNRLHLDIVASRIQVLFCNPARSRYGFLPQPFTTWEELKIVMTGKFLSKAINSTYWTT